MLRLAKWVFLIFSIPAQAATPLRLCLSDRAGDWTSAMMLAAHETGMLQRAFNVRLSFRRDVLESLAKGDCDVAAGPFAQVRKMSRARRAGLKPLVLQYVEKPGTFVLAVPASSGVKNFEELHQTRIALLSPEHSALLDGLNRRFPKTSLLPGDPLSPLELLTSQRFTAALIGQPFAPYLLAAKRIKVVKDRILHAAGQDILPESLLAGRRAFFAQEPEREARLAAALSEAASYIMHNPAQQFDHMKKNALSLGLKDWSPERAVLHKSAMHFDITHAIFFTGPAGEGRKKQLTKLHGALAHEPAIRDWLH